MQIFFLKPLLSPYCLFFAIWALVPLLARVSLPCSCPIVCLNPTRFLLARAPFGARRPQFYERVFHIRSWKHLLPDGGGVWK